MSMLKYAMNGLIFFFFLSDAADAFVPSKGDQADPLARQAECVPTQQAPNSFLLKEVLLES